MSVAALYPEQAAKWRLDAGHSLSIVTLAEMGSGNPLSDSAKQDLWEHDPKFVVDCQSQKVKTEQEAEEFFEKEADRMRRNREGDKAVDFQNAKA